MQRLFTNPSYPNLASELRWPAYTNLDTPTTFFFVGLFEDESSHPKYEICCQATGLSTPGFLRGMAEQDGYI